MTARGLIVSAPRSSSGKTTVTLGLLGALRRRGVAVRAAKSGPDYIDPAFHAAADRRQGRYLDTWAMPPPAIDALIAEAAHSSDVLVIEGAMGLFDGVPGIPGRSGAASDLAAVFLCRCCSSSTCQASRNRRRRLRRALRRSIRRFASAASC